MKTEHHTVVAVSLSIHVESDAPLTDAEKTQIADWAQAELQSNAEYGTDFEFRIGNIAVKP